jgi:hypothetical protein
MPAIWLNRTAARSSTRPLSRPLWASGPVRTQFSWSRRRNGSMQSRNTPKKTPPALAITPCPSPVPYRSVPGASDTLAIRPLGLFLQSVASLIPAATLTCPVCRASTRIHRTPVAGAFPAPSSSGYNLFKCSDKPYYHAWEPFATSLS